MQYQDSGVIWCTSDEIKGGRRYFNQAVLSAKSFKRHNPGVKTAIFRDDETLNDGVFDYHLKIHRNIEEKNWTTKYLEDWSPTKRITNLKVLCSVRSPFYKTLHLDADTYVLDDVREIFDMLDEYSILLTNADRVKRNTEGLNIGCTELTASDQANSGVYAFRKDEKASFILGEQWLKLIEELGIGEQAVQTLYIREPEKYMQGIKWACIDNIIYNAQRRMWRSMFEYGLWDEAKILHFARYQALVQLHNGEITKDDLLELDDVKSCDPKWLHVRPRAPLSSFKKQ